MVATLLIFGIHGEYLQHLQLHKFGKKKGGIDYTILDFLSQL